MSCNFYVHQDLSGGAKYISGTTCSGTNAYYYLTYGQSICMDNDRPLVNLNGLIISGSCLPITPTPSTTPLEYCFVSGLTYTTVPYQCPNDGLIYYDVYGSLRITATIGGRIEDTNPAIPVSISNGVQTQIITIPQGQTSTEFVYPKVDFRYTNTGCVSTSYPDWYIIGSPSITQCLFFTPTPTTTPSQTPTQTQTNTQTPTQTSSETPTHTPTQTSTPTTTLTATNTQTPTNTQTGTETQTPTPTQTQTQTPTNTITQTPTATSNPVCPEQIIVSNSNPVYSGAVGTYTRTYTYSGGSFNYGYFSANTGGATFMTGLDGTGNGAIVYQYYNATLNQYWQLVGFSNPTPNQIINFDLFDTVGGFLSMGYQPLLPLGTGTLDLMGVINNGGVLYPAKGQTAFNDFYISYPASCPTPTPTPTQTSTNTPTLTNTKTPTPTPTELSGRTQAELYLRAVVDAGGTGITPTISACTITLFQQIISNGLWNKIQAFYPMLGGNSNGTKFNAKNPVDTNIAYRLQFNGGWAYSSSGITSNGTNAYANTFLSGTSVGVLNNHLGVYMNTNNIGGLTWIGASAPGGEGHYFSLGSDGTPKFVYGNRSRGIITSTEAPTPVGFNIISSVSSSSNKHFYNGVLKFTAFKNNTNNITSSVIIGALNNSGSIIQYYANTYSFATIGSGLTDTEAINYTNIINTFNACIGRNNYPAITQTPTPSFSPTPSITASQTPTNTGTPNATPSNTPTNTSTPSNTPTNTQTPTNTGTQTPTPNITPTITQTPSNTPTKTPTQTPSTTPVCSLYFDGGSSLTFSAATGTYILSDDGINQSKYISSLGSIVNCGTLSGSSWSLWYKITGNRTYLIGANEGNNAGRFTWMNLEPNNIPTCSYDYLGGTSSSDSILSGTTRNGLIIPISGTSTTENGYTVSITYLSC